MKNPLKWLREKVVDVDPNIASTSLERSRESEDKAPAITSTITGIMGDTAQALGKLFFKLPLSVATKVVTAPLLAISAVGSVLRSSDAPRTAINNISAKIDQGRQKIFDALTRRGESSALASAAV